MSTWKNSGDTISGLQPGRYKIRFESTYPEQTIVLNSNENKIVDLRTPPPTPTPSPTPPEFDRVHLTVNIKTRDTNSHIGTWTRSGLPRRFYWPSGYTHNVDPGNYEISFSNLESQGYRTPSSVNVSLTPPSYVLDVVAEKL